MLFRSPNSHGPSQPQPTPGWFSKDNGFSNENAMRKAHLPIVVAARTRLAEGDVRAVIDLGCGNGVLAVEVAAGFRIHPFGIDRNASAVEHAKQLHPKWASNFRTGRIDDLTLWDGVDGALAIIATQRLLEFDIDALGRLRGVLRRRARGMVAYEYGSNERSAAEILQRCEFGVDLEMGRHLALVRGM